jgi:hypothetical protein
MIEIDMASGNLHYCQRCWPRGEDVWQLHEGGSGHETWVQVGNYFMNRWDWEDQHGVKPKSKKHRASAAERFFDDW